MLDLAGHLVITR